MNVYLVGTHGYGSLGDDLNHRILKDCLRAAWPDVHITSSRTDARPFSPETEDLLLLGGSGWAYHHRYPCGSDSLRQSLRYAASMQWFDKPVCALGVGTQGPVPPEEFARYRDVFDGMRLIAARDHRTAAQIRNLGITGPVFETADLGYLMPRIHDPQIPGQPVLSIAASMSDAGVIYPADPGFERRMADAATDLSSSFALRTLSFQAQADAWLQQAIPAQTSASYDGTNPESAKAVVAEIASSTVLVTTRLHGLIAAVVHGVPFVAIGGPDEKLQRECEALGYPWFLPFSASASQIVSTLREVALHRCRWSNHLRDRRRQRVELARRNLDLLFRLMSPDVPQPMPIGPEGPTLVVWAAPERFWPEVEDSLTKLGPSDVLLPPSERIVPARSGVGVIPVPAPGILNWHCLSEELRHQIGDRYHKAVIAHTFDGSVSLEALRNLAQHAAPQVAEFQVWTGAVRPMNPDGIPREASPEHAAAS